MMHLWESGPQRQADLISLLDSDAATMTRTIRRLEHAGFVRRVPLADDKRASLIEPTAASRALRTQVEQIWTQLEQIAVGGVNPRERQTILRVLEGLEARLTRASTNAGPTPAPCRTGPTNEAPPALAPGGGGFVLHDLVRVTVVMAVAVVFLLGRLIDDGCLGSSRCTNANDHRLAALGTSARAMVMGHRWVEPEDCTGADLPFSACDPRSVSPGGRASRASTVWWVRRIASPVVLVSCSTRAATLTVSPIRSRRACRRRRWCRITDTGVDPDADPKRAAESLGSSLVLMPRHAGSCSDFGGIDDRQRLHRRWRAPRRLRCTGSYGCNHALRFKLFRPGLCFRARCWRGRHADRPLRRTRYLCLQRYVAAARRSSGSVC